MARISEIEFAYIPEYDFSTKDVSVNDCHILWAITPYDMDLTDMGLPIPEPEHDSHVREWLIQTTKGIEHAF